MLVRYDARKRVLVLTKGHPWDRAAFSGMLDSFKGISFTEVEQPAGAQMIGAGLAESYDAILFHDVPGIQFRTPKAPDLIEPDEAFKAGFRALLEAGKPMLFLHHAIAGWPLWDDYAEAIGARYFYQPGRYKGRVYPDSGYLFPVTYEAQPIAGHPITEGLDPFTLTDELYLFDMLEPVTPLFRARHSFDPALFHSSVNALQGRMWTSDGWAPPKGTNLIGWTKTSGRAPVVVLQCGNDGGTFGHVAFQQVMRRSLDWLLDTRP